jgi:hypothetical protein
MTKNFYVTIFVPCVGMLATLIALWKYKYWNSHSRMLFFYLLLCCIFNTIAKLTQGSNNLPYLHLYTVLEFTSLTLFFSTYSIKKRKFYLLNFSFIAIAIWYGFIYENIYSFNLIPRFLGSLIICLYCLFFLLKHMNYADPSIKRIDIIAISGLLLYYSTCTIWFGMSNLVLNIPKEISSLIWKTHSTVNMIMYVMLGTAYATLKKE